MPRTKDQAARNVGGNSKSGNQDKKGPSFSVKGFTSKDPANVARNRAGAAKYATKSERMVAAKRDTNADKAAAMAAARAVRPAAPAPVMASKVAPTTTAPRPGMMATKPPAGYRPGIDPEFNYRAGTPGAAPTVKLGTLSTGTGTMFGGAGPRGTPGTPLFSSAGRAMAKGGKAKGKKK